MCVLNTGLDQTLLGLCMEQWWAQAMELVGDRSRVVGSEGDKGKKGKSLPWAGRLPEVV